MHALVIDSDLRTLDAMNLLLTSWGWSTRVATSAREACDVIAAGGEVPHLILVDQVLEAGESGLAAIEQVRALFGDRIPALVMVSDHGAPFGASADAPVLLQKPVAPDYLKAAIDAAMRATGGSI